MSSEVENQTFIKKLIDHLHTYIFKKNVFYNLDKDINAYMYNDNLEALTTLINQLKDKISLNTNYYIYEDYNEDDDIFYNLIEIVNEIYKKEKKDTSQTYTELYIRQYIMHCDLELYQSYSNNNSNNNNNNNNSEEENLPYYVKDYYNYRITNS